jgi:uncharacterized protein (TIGR04255 family)
MAGDWPLVQLGLGLTTLNETSKYTWDDFRERAVAVVGRLFDAHPKPSDLRIESLVLRYIDAIEFDYSSDNILGFLKDKMKVRVELPDALFDTTGVAPSPHQLNWQCAFGLTEPRGNVTVKFATGKREKQPALIWETIVGSAGDQLPGMPEGFQDWLNEAHDVTDDWFFKLIEGDLERRFSAE